MIDVSKLISEKNIGTQERGREKLHKLNSNKSNKCLPIPSGLKRM
jgi:hypothetical protein